MARKSTTTKRDLQKKPKSELVNLILMLLNEKYRLECMLDKFKGDMK